MLRVLRLPRNDPLVWQRALLKTEVRQHFSFLNDKDVCAMWMETALCVYQDLNLKQ